jgi:polar amino acid transport system substrate-binding protein
MRPLLIVLIIGCLLFISILYHYFSIKSSKKLLAMHEAKIKTFKTSFDIIDDSVIILSEKNELIYINKSMQTLLKLDKNLIFDFFDKIPKIKPKTDWIGLDEFIQSKKNITIKKQLVFPKIKLKITRDIEKLITLYLDTVRINGDKKKYYTLITIKDLSQLEEYSQLPYRHKLTNFPNQTQCMEDLPKLFSKAHTSNNKIALVLLGFDNFSKLRAIIGHDQSNEIIIKFAKNLNIIMSDMDIHCYHTFDNQFLLTLSKVGSIEEVHSLISDIQKKLSYFYKINNENLHLTVSAGISIYPESGATNKLFDHTYKALVNAQAKGTSEVSVYKVKNQKHIYDELTLCNHMLNSMNNGEFEVYYQPIIKSKTQEIIGAEALVRWIHPDFGFVPPDIFIGLMEETGFITVLGRFVLEEVLKQQKRWELFKFKQIEISINVSMIEIASGDFVENVKKQLQHHNVNPETIKFEITESVAMSNEIQLEHYFHALRKLGCGLALDDFGTGYTSFSYLKKFPANILKIDKSLIDHIINNEDDQRIVKGMIELGHNLGFKIVVEGIETLEMVDLITSYGCDYLQGYYFSKPLPVFEFQKLLRETIKG